MIALLWARTTCASTVRLSSDPLARAVGHGDDPIERRGNLGDQYGRPVTRCHRYGASWARTTSSSMPTSTSMLTREVRDPLAQHARSGSIVPMTLGNAALMMASVHGPVRPT